MFDTYLLLVIALILMSTKVLAMFMRRIHLPQVVGALMAGVLLGPAVFNLAQPNDIISAVAEFGVIFLLFAAGMETNLRELRNSIKPAILVSSLGIVLALLGGFGLALLFGKSLFESFFIGIIIASMSTSITVETLQEMGKLKSKVGTVILGASLFDDIIVIIMLAVIMGVGIGGATFGSIGIILLKILGFFVLALGLGFLVNKLYNFSYEKYGEKKRFTIFALAYCFFMAYLAEMLGLADITGAYLAGIAFCSTKCVEYMEIKVQELSYMFFTPIFLANIGIQTSFDGMTQSLVLFTIALVVVAIVSKGVGSGLGARLCNLSNRESVQVGAGMVARGEVSFIVATKGIAIGYISSLLFPSIIVVVLVTVLVTPLLLKAAFAEKTKPAEGDKC